MPGLVLTTSDLSPIQSREDSFSAGAVRSTPRQNPGIEDEGANGDGPAVRTENDYGHLVTHVQAGSSRSAPARTAPNMRTITEGTLPGAAIFGGEQLSNATGRPWVDVSVIRSHVNRVTGDPSRSITSVPAIDQSDTRGMLEHEEHLAYLRWRALVGGIEGVSPGRYNSSARSERRSISPGDMSNRFAEETGGEPQ